MKWQVIKMGRSQNSKLTEWQVDDMESWQNDKLTKWQVDKWIIPVFPQGQVSYRCSLQQGVNIVNIYSVSLTHWTHMLVCPWDIRLLCCRVLHAFNKHTKVSLIYWTNMQTVQDSACYRVFRASEKCAPMSLMCLSATKTLHKYTSVIDELYNIFCSVTDAL